jgi:hypothetical protein
MDFGVDFGALSPFVKPKTKCVLHPPTFLTDPGNPVDCVLVSAIIDPLPSLGAGGWRLLRHRPPVKQNLVPYHCKCEYRTRKLRIAVIVILLRLSGAAVFSLIRVSKPKLKIELDVAVLP